MTDNTKYVFNNEVYGKGLLVLAVVKQYVHENNPSYEELKLKFPPNLLGGKPVIISEEDLIKRKQNSTDTKARYFEKDADRLTTSDGKIVYVSNQWGLGNIDNFIKKAKELGYDIQVAGNSMKSLKELFDEYKRNPRADWIERYRERCKQLSGYKGKTSAEYDTALLKDVWLTPANGIASASPGFISIEEFDHLLKDLPGITSKIVENPSPEILDEVMTWAEQAKQDGKFNSKKVGVIHRVFAAANPDHYSTILRRRHVLKFIKQLVKNYSLEIKTDGNWAELNISLLQSIKSQGLENEDVFEVNTFIWDLYESLNSEDIEQNGEDEIINEGTMDNEEDRTCRNIIYYGPPGTGKTYKLQDVLRKQYTDKGTKLDEQLWLRSEVESLKWYELIILILIESDKPLKVVDIIAHNYYQIKAELNERNAHLSNTAWSSLNSHTVNESITVNSAQRIDPLVFDKNDDSSWFLVDSASDLLNEYKTISQKLKAGPEVEDTIERYKFVTFHQSYGYEEFIEGLRPETNAKGDISYVVKPGVFKLICQHAEKDPEHRYAMVIDEINRGNISKIFGELITLIEVDKRTGADNELILNLAYSEKPFSVPSNLDIIGTMNTADRSLTHIDVALRRRFHFEELRTDYSLIPENVEGIKLRWMLYAINQRIELLLDREHILGHALLMHASSLAEIAHVFKTNIMPLLEEYFFENWDKINQALNDNGFIQEQKGAYSTWLGNTDDYAAKSYRINVDAMQSVEAYQSIYAGVDASAFAELE